MIWYIAALGGPASHTKIENGLMQRGHSVVDIHSLVAHDDEERALQQFEALSKAEGMVLVNPFASMDVDESTEFGMCLALNKRLVITGGTSSIYHYLPNVEIYPSVAKFMAALTEQEGS